MTVLLVLWAESAFVMGIVVLGFICFHLLEKYIKPYLNAPKYPRYINSSLKDHVWKLEYYMRIEEADDRPYVCANSHEVVTIEVFDGVENQVERNCVRRDTPDGYHVLPYPRTARSESKTIPDEGNTYYISDPYRIKHIDDVRIDKVNRDRIYGAKNNDAMFSAIMDAFDSYYDVNDLTDCCKHQSIAEKCSRLISGNVVMTKKVTDGDKLVYYFTKPFTQNSRICNVKGFAYWMMIWFLSLNENTFFGYLQAILQIEDICDDVGVGLIRLRLITNIASKVAEQVHPEITYPSVFNFYGGNMKKFIIRNFDRLVDTDVVSFNHLLQMHQNHVKNILKRTF